MGTRFRTAFCLSLILLLAAILRLDDLVSQAYMLDEDWSVEISTGRGSVHQHLPLNQVIPPPQFYSLADAPPWWHIWSNMEVTHPPLYSSLLRGWEDSVGDTDYNGRLFSVIFSLLAIALLFDVVRLQAGLGPAIWAALLMALAAPQVEHARLTRSYTLLTAVALIAIDIVVRIEKRGISTPRWILLVLIILATLMTHYFCVGALAGLAVYCIVSIPRHRCRLMLAFALSGLIFSVIWLPWMWQQRHLFATDDPSTLFLTTNGSHHLRDTIIRLLMDPIRMLFPQSETGPGGILRMILGAALFTLPFLPIVRRRNSSLLLWGLWLVGSVIVAAILDLLRGTDHLLYIRYTILAGPAAYALIPMLCTQLAGKRFVLHVIGALVVLVCAIELPNVYHYDDVDPRLIAREFIVRPGPHDLLIFASPPLDTQKCEIELFMLARYMQPMTCPVVILTKPANAEVLSAARNSRFVFLDTQTSNYQQYLPGARLIKGRTYRNLGNLFTLDLNGSK